MRTPRHSPQGSPQPHHTRLLTAVPAQKQDDNIPPEGPWTSVDTKAKTQIPKGPECFLLEGVHIVLLTATFHSPKSTLGTNI